MKKQFINIALFGLFLFGCQKQEAPTLKTDGISSKVAEITKVVDSSSVSNGRTITAAAIPNCGIATLPTPVAGNGTVILPAGTIMAVYQPSNETQYPSSVYFGSSYEFTIQGDGNLVLYNRSTGKSLWSSQTATGGAFKQINSYVILQGDGNLVIRQRDKNNNIVEIWGTHTILCANQSLPKLVLQSDGNIVEEYECAHRGNLTHGFIGNTGTGGGGQSSHPGKF